MSRIYINGFDHEHLNYLISDSERACIVSGMHDKCLELQAQHGRSNIQYDFPVATYSVLSFGFNYNPADFTFRFKVLPNITDNAYVEMSGNSSSITIFLYNHNRTLDSSFIYYTSTANAQRNLQIMFTKSGSAMAMAVKLDGTQLITSSGMSCADSNLMDSFGIYNEADDVSCDLQIDDLIIDDASWVGMKKILTLEPNAEGDTMEFIAFSGNTYDCVDNPYNESDYIYGNAFDDLCLFELESITGSPASISSLSMLLSNKQMEGPPPTMYFQDALKSGSTVVNGSSVEAGTMGTDFKGFFKVWETSPFTSSAWTESEINGLQAGIRLKSS